MRDSAWQSAAAAMEIERDALHAMGQQLERAPMERAVKLLASAERIAAAGCGHSGIACEHLAHLLCCIGLSAKVLAPSEAAHGGMGYLHAGDALVLLSRGGQTAELLPLMRIARERGAGVIAVTENMASELALAADVVLPLHITRECDRYNCQGTTSFIVSCALFDALQCALIEETGYTAAQFAQVHPGGAVGRRLNG